MQLEAVSRCECQRLFDKHVLARIEPGAHHSVVEVVGQAHVDEVQTGVVEHVLVPLERDDTQLVGARPHQLAIDVADCD